jgi:hypothetical protein
MDQPQSAAMDLGNRLEAAVLDYAEEQLGPLERNVEVMSPDLPFMGSNLDARVIETQNPVEAKTYGILWAGKADQWGDDGSSEVPDYIAVQAYAQMFCAQKDVCFVPALIGGRGLSMFTILRDEETMGLIIERCQDFWLKNVMTNTPPDESAPSLDVVKRIQREPGEIVTLADELVEAWIEAKAQFSVAEKAKEEAQAKVLAALGSCEDGRCALGNVTYHSQNRAGFTVAATSFRVLRLSKPKKK